MATTLTNETENKNGLDNIAQIRNNLKNLLNDLDHHDQILSEGFKDIQSLIDAQRKKFEKLSTEYDKAKNNAPNDVQSHSINAIPNQSESEIPSFQIRMNPFPSMPTLNDLQLPPKREPIKIIPFKPIDIDYDILNEQIEKMHQPQIKKPQQNEPQNDDDDNKQQQEMENEATEEMDEKQNEIFSETEDEDADDEVMDEAMIKMLQNEKSANLKKMALPKEVKQKLGDSKTWKLPKKKFQKKRMERDLRKIVMALDDLDETQRKYAKLSILKYYDMLYETYHKYCKIGGDKDWLTQKGWNSLCHDAFVIDKKSQNCKEPQIKVKSLSSIYSLTKTKKTLFTQALFKQIYDFHHNAHRQRKASKHHKDQILRASTLNFSEWNDVDPWSGIWIQQNSESEEVYKLKQVGDTKLIGFVKNFDFCDINGRINSAKRNKAQFVIFWHEGARKGKRRECKCTLNKPQNVTDAVTMTLDWKSIGTSEEGSYTMTKYEALSDTDSDLFSYRMGLARHEYFDAMMLLAKMKFSEHTELRYEALCKLCEENIIPFVWGGMDKANEAMIKSLFRPHSTDLHKLFGSYSCMDGSEHNLLGLEVWKVLCADVLKQDKHAFGKGGKPTKSDIVASFELAKEGYDLELTYKGFENALRNFAAKMYKKKPKQKYSSMAYNDKLKKLLKWAVKLSKSGYVPTMTTPKK